MALSSRRNVGQFPATSVSCSSFPNTCGGMDTVCGLPFLVCYLPLKLEPDGQDASFIRMQTEAILGLFRCWEALFFALFLRYH